jgi:hypothetical protein
MNSRKELHAYGHSLIRILPRVRDGAGGSPPGEPPAPPASIVDGSSPGLRERLPDTLVDELLAGAKSEQEIIGPGGLLAGLTKRLARARWRSS